MSSPSFRFVILFYYHSMSSMSYYSMSVGIHFVLFHHLPHLPHLHLPLRILMMTTPPPTPLPNQIQTHLPGFLLLLAHFQLFQIHLQLLILLPLRYVFHTFLTFQRFVIQIFVTQTFLIIQILSIPPCLFFPIY